MERIPKGQTADSPIRLTNQMANGKDPSLKSPVQKQNQASKFKTIGNKYSNNPITENKIKLKKN